MCHQLLLRIKGENIVTDDFNHMLASSIQYLLHLELIKRISFLLKHSFYNDVSRPVVVREHETSFQHSYCIVLPKEKKPTSTDTMENTHIKQVHWISTMADLHFV